MDPLTEKYVGKFYGPNKITAIEVLDAAEPAMIRITIEKVIKDQTFVQRHFLSEAALGAYVTDEASDYTQLFRRKVEMIVPLMLSAVETYSVDYTEVDPLAEEFKKQLKFVFDRSMSIAFTGDDESFAPGWNPLNDVSFAQAKFLIEGAAPKENGAG